MRERIFAIFANSFQKYHHNEDERKIDFEVKIKVNKTNDQNGHYAEGQYRIGFGRAMMTGVMHFEEYAFSDLERSEQESGTLDYVVATERHILYLNKKIDYLIANTINIFSMLPVNGI